METKSVVLVNKVNEGKVYNFAIAFADFIAVYWQINCSPGLSRALGHS